MAKSPAAVQLGEILRSLKSNQQEVPKALQDLVDKEKEMVKPELSAKVTAGAPVPTPKKPSIKKQSKIARVVLRHLVGEKWSKKLIKPEKAVTHEIVKENTMRSDIKRIKQDVSDIKAFLQLNTVTGRKQTFISRVKNAILTHRKPGERGAPRKDLRMIKMPERPDSMIRKPGMPDPMISNPIEGTTMARVRTENVERAIFKAQKQNQVDRESLGHQEQVDVSKKATQVHEDEERKKTDDKLDKIDKELVDMKKGHKGLIEAILAGAGALLTKVIGGVFKLAKKIMGAVGDIGKWLLKKIPTVLRWIGKIAKGVWDVAGKVGLKGLQYLTEGAAELGIEGAGLFGAAGVLGVGVGKMLTLQGRAYKNANEMLSDYGIKVPRLGHYEVNGKKYHAPGEPAASDDEEEAPEVIQKLVETAGLKSVDQKDPTQISLHEEWLKKHADEVAQYRKPGAEGKVEGISGSDTGTIDRDDEDFQKSITDATNLKPEDIGMTAEELEGQYNVMKATEDSKENDDDEKTPTIVVTAPQSSPAPIRMAPPPEPAPSGVILTRNPENSISRLASTLFDDVAGWSGLSRI